MKLTKPSISMHGDTKAIDERRYLTHCDNVARILASETGGRSTDDKLKMYLEIVGAEFTVTRRGAT